MTDGETNTLALRGLEEPAHASRGLEELFLQLCCCVSFLFWQEIGFGYTTYVWYQSKTIRGTNYYKRDQFFYTYYSSVHLA